MGSRIDKAEKACTDLGAKGNFITVRDTDNGKYRMNLGYFDANGNNKPDKGEVYVSTTPLETTVFQSMTELKEGSTYIKFSNL
jgi:hypothetical protein